MINPAPAPTIFFSHGRAQITYGCPIPRKDAPYRPFLLTYPHCAPQ